MKQRSLLQRIIGAPYVLWAAIFIVVPLFIVSGNSYLYGMPILHGLQAERRGAMQMLLEG